MKSGKARKIISCTIFVLGLLCISGIVHNYSSNQNGKANDISENISKVEENTVEINQLEKIQLSVKVKKGEFIHVSNKKLINQSGKEYQIKGIAFGNNAWYNPTSAPVTHHDEESYKELAKLGFNTVRFYINYELFEADGTPYKYKEAGFKWINKNIEWAKKYGIKLIINMHVPQGGFISTTNISFWKTENMNRFLGLWTAIANRYKNEPTILGYGLINEPYMPYFTNTTDALDLYYGFIEQTINRVRTKDKKHIIFIERPYGCVNTTKKEVTYPWGDVGSFRKVKDTNVVYEYHFYDKIEFTAQKLTWINTFRDWYYNDDTRIIMSGKRVWKRAIDLTTSNVKKEEWVSVKSNLQLMRNEGNTGFWYLTVFNSDTKNTINIDDIIMKEYDSNGKYIRDIYEYDFSNITFCDGWDLGSGGGGKYSYDSKIGCKAAGSAKISNVGVKYKIYITYNENNFFRIQEGNYYQFTAKVKSSNSDIVLVPGIQMNQIDKLYNMNIEYLEYKLNIFNEWSNSNNVPIYLGEFGVTRHIMGNKYKGEEWVKDMFTLLNKYHMNYNYHDYHEENYGLYIEDGRKARKNVNKILYKIFESEVPRN